MSDLKISPTPWSMQYDGLGCKNIVDANGVEIMCTDGLDNEEEDLANAQFVCNATVHIIHCEGCGNSWYDSGWTPSCPSCRIAKLEAQMVELSIKG